MDSGRPDRRVALLASQWGDGSERAFAVRSLAGALSQVAAVDVLVPGPDGPARPDGLFDLVPIGSAAPGALWPTGPEALWPEGWPPDLVLADRIDPEILALSRRYAPGCPVLAIDRAPDHSASGVTGLVGVGVTAGQPGPVPVHPVGLHVPVHPLAAERRHNGFGFTGYVLVLSDRMPTDTPTDDPGHRLTAAAAWLAAGLPERDLVVVENGIAGAWRGRALRGLVPIDTRTDLWRLAAHALVTVDLAPGQLLARECVESLRYGTPVVVPAGTAAAELAALGGGLWYSDPAELLACVKALGDRRVRETLGDQGRQQADAWYGDPAPFVERVSLMLDAVLGSPARR